MSSEQNQGQPTPPTLPPMPPSGGGGSRTGLLVGGCAVAAVLGIIAILAVGAFLFFFLSRPVAPEPQPTQPEPTQLEPTQPEPTPEPTQPQPEPTQPEPPSDGGSLDELIQQQVGDFSLQQIEEIPEAISAGATDARTMVYASPDGVQISHDLTAWTSADVANQQIQAIGESLASKGFQQTKEFPVTNEEGQQIGSGVVYVGEVEGTTIEAILWSNDVLFCSIFAPEGYSVDFYNNLPY